MSKFATTADVRAWAVANGIEVKPEGTRGRLPKAAIEGFNADKANRAKYRGVQPTKVVVTAKPEKGRAVRKTATTNDIRAFAVANGLSKPGQRGRFSSETLRAFVLGTDA